MENKTQLKVLGLTYTQTQSQAFALILGEENSKRRLPVLIGPIEAQAIALLANAVNLPRPLTHDLIIDVLKVNGMQLREVQIYKEERGIFHSHLVCYRADDDQTIKMESRTSDAVALAVLTNCPIYTSEEILQESSIEIDEKMFMTNSSQVNEITPVSSLEAELQRAIDEENYELAATIRDELKAMGEQQ